jgi:hypothetical protein
MTPVPLSNAAQSLRIVIDMLLQDMASEPVDPATLAWDQPILVLRSASMARMQAFLDRLVVHCPKPTLHIMSHARDEQAIRDMTPCEITYHAFPTPGPYRLLEVPSAMLERLRSTGFGTLFMLDQGLGGDLLEDVERLLAAIQPSWPVSFRGDDTFARTQDWSQRRLARLAFLRLIEWYHLKLDPGFPDGPVPPDGAMAASLK